MRAVQLTSFGDPVDGLQYVDIPEPDAPGPNQVLIGVEFSPINPNDLMVAQGIYAFRPPLPAVIGNEGVGRVLAVGPGVESVKVGDRVLAPPASFTWRERIVVSAGGLSASNVSHISRENIIAHTMASNSAVIPPLLKAKNLSASKDGKFARDVRRMG
jgi:NADPH:quinone reductase-like Zn-dependent oxidoreductase